MIEVNGNFTKSEDGYWEMLAQVEYPDYDSQGILNNAQITVLVESACERLFKSTGEDPEMFFSSIREYDIVFNRGIQFKNDQSEIVVPMVRIKVDELDSTKIIVHVVESVKTNNIFTTVKILLQKDSQPKATAPGMSEDSPYWKYSIPFRSTNVNRYGYYHLSRLATFLESTHLWFFGKGCLETDWIRHPLPIIVKAINIHFFEALRGDWDVECILRIADPEGRSSVKFWIELVKAGEKNYILARAHLLVVHVNPSQTDWNKTKICSIPETIRKKLNDLYHGKIQQSSHSSNSCAAPKNN